MEKRETVSGIRVFVKFLSIIHIWPMIYIPVPLDKHQMTGLFKKNLVCLLRYMIIGKYLISKSSSLKLQELSAGVSTKSGGVVIAGGAGFGKTAVVEKIVKTHPKLAQFLTFGEKTRRCYC